MAAGGAHAHAELGICVVRFGTWWASGKKRRSVWLRRFLVATRCVAMEPDYAVTLTPVVAAAEVDPVPLELVAKLGRNCCRSDCSEA